VAQGILDVVVLQKYNTIFRPGARYSSRALSERQLCGAGSNDGGNPPFFNKHAFLFSSGKSDTDNLLKNRLKWDKVPYSKNF